MSNFLTTEQVSRSDEQILRESVAHPSLFALLVDKYQKEFFRKALKIMGSTEEATDIVQDTFVKIYSNASKFEVREGATFKSWAYAILINTCYTYAKKRTRDRVFVEKLDHDELDVVAAFADNEDKRLDFDHFFKVIQRLPKAFASLLRARVVDGKSYESIAEEEGVSVGVIRTRLHRAKKEFKKALS